MDGKAFCDIWEENNFKTLKILIKELLNTVHVPTHKENI